MMPVLRRNGSIRDFPSLFFDSSPLDDFARVVNQFSGGEVSKKFLDAEIIEHPDRYELLFDVPGVPRDDIDLSVEEKVLTIKITRQKLERDEGATIRHSTRWYGSLSRQFSLPLVASEVTAELQDGVLKVIVEKQPEVQARKIEVK